MKTNIELVKFAKRAFEENWGYCLGTFGSVLTPQLLKQKMNQGYRVGKYNTRHKSYLQKFIGKRVSDCYGLVKAFVWWNGGNVKYIPSQDRNQEGAFRAAKEKGPISNIPEIPGIVLWMKGHAGIYIGNGEFVECKGVPVGMQKGKIINGRVISGSKFTHWFKDTYITYLDEKRPTVSAFKDVDGNRWSANCIEKAAELGLIKGDGQGKFNPTGPLTREQAAVLTVRLYEKIKEECK